MDRSELEKQLLDTVGKLTERAVLSLVECAGRMLAGDRNGAARRAEEGARRQKLQSAHDSSVLRLKNAEREVQARLERKKATEANGGKKPKKSPAGDESKPDGKDPA